MISQLIARGIGFNPGSVKYIVTLGLSAGSPPVVFRTLSITGTYLPSKSLVGTNTPTRTIIGN